MATLDINEAFADLIRDVSAIRTSQDDMYRQLIGNGQPGKIPRMEEDISQLKDFVSANREDMESFRDSAKVISWMGGFFRVLFKVTTLLLAAATAIFGALKLYFTFRG